MLGATLYEMLFLRLPYLEATRGRRNPKNPCGSFKGSTSNKGSYKGLGFKGSSAQIVYMLTLNRHYLAKLYTTWVHGPLGKGLNWSFFMELHLYIETCFCFCEITGISL